MTRPTGDPTHYLPLWVGASGDFVDFSNGWRVGRDGAPLLIPADRVTVAPEPYTPQVGDRVQTDTGDEATLLAADILRGTLPCVWHDAMQPDQYGTIDLSQIVGLA